MSIITIKWCTCTELLRPPHSFHRKCTAKIKAGAEDSVSCVETTDQTLSSFGVFSDLKVK